MKKILLFDFESHFNKNIVDILNKYHVSFEMVKADFQYRDDLDYAGIILTGSKDHVYDRGRTIDIRFLQAGIPSLCICYGHQLANYLFKGNVVLSNSPENNIRKQLIIDKDNPIFKGINNPVFVAMHHYDEVDKLGAGFISLAHTDECKYAAAYNPDKKIYTLQFHPEDEKMSDFPEKYFTNFFDICGIQYFYNEFI